MAKKNDSKVYIGRKKSMNYVLAAMVIINEAKPVRLLARGRAISRAVDVAEILRNNFAKGASYGEIKIGTEEITNKDGTKSNVSSMEIELIPAKK
ncbi:MAG: DNA-binding protein Alba [Candidatus Lokiarchaeota archaeon]|nr:DNA-binding protein Alba [Candidatus Lokiarchaeota archaeon]MBD3339142.1 DNA-binding protein Alba [Candidatus Lokiarchaeota archaeon]